MLIEEIKSRTIRWAILILPAKYFRDSTVVSLIVLSQNSNNNKKQTKKKMNNFYIHFSFFNSRDDDSSKSACIQKQNKKRQKNTDQNNHNQVRQIEPELCWWPNHSSGDFSWLYCGCNIPAVKRTHWACSQHCSMFNLIIR